MAHPGSPQGIMINRWSMNASGFVFWVTAVAGAVVFQLTYLVGKRLFR